MHDQPLTPDELLFIERAVFEAKTSALEEIATRRRRSHAGWIDQVHSPLGRRRHIASVRARVAAGSPGAALVGRRALLSSEALREELDALSSKSRSRKPREKAPRELSPAEAHEQEMDRLHKKFGLRRPTDAERAERGLPPYDRDRAYAEFLEREREKKESEEQKKRDDNDSEVVTKRAAAMRSRDEQRLPKYTTPRVPCPRCGRPVQLRKSGSLAEHECPHEFGRSCCAADDDPSGLKPSCPWCAKERER